jgi:hypothetical protein
MPPRKRSASPGRGKAPDKTGRPADPAGGSGGGDHVGQSRPLQRNPDADPVRIHREYVQQRVGGGALPTPGAYERAVDQWHRLPGAVRAPAGEVHPLAEQFASEVEHVEEELTETAAVETTGPYDGMLPATDPGDNSPYEDREQ